MMMKKFVPVTKLIGTFAFSFGSGHAYAPSFSRLVVIDSFS